MNGAQATSGVIFDIGAHVGQDTEFYLKRGFRVVAVEANPELAKALREQFSSALKRGDLTVVEAAIAERSGSGKFYKFGTSVFGTTSSDWADRNAQMGQTYDEIDVAFVTVEELFARYGTPYYMKVDIEGADMLCIQGLRNVAKPRYLSIEVEKRDFQRFKQEVAAIRDLGYDRFQLVQQEFVPLQHIPNPPREGAAAQHRFPFGSSGLFGKELPEGGWVSYDALVAEYEPIVRRHAIFGDYSLGRYWAPRQILRLLRLYPGWHDLHARYRD